MNTNYYVIAVQGRYMVLRESQSRGLHDRPEQAVRAACFMASSEAEDARANVEVFVQNRSGRFYRTACYRGQHMSSLRMRPHAQFAA
ncbi:MAG: hypothetical protein KDJ14_13210 [Xanthomonadales bacterium]|nr:hypothetical protein [Xanthomonadales bacterium]